MSIPGLLGRRSCPRFRRIRRGETRACASGALQATLRELEGARHGGRHFGKLARAPAVAFGESRWSAALTDGLDREPGQRPTAGRAARADASDVSGTRT